MAQAKTLKQLADEAETAMKAGDADRAILLFGQVLVKAPGHSKAKKAMQRLKRSVAGQPVTQADANRAIRLLQSGRASDATALCRRLLLAAPNEPLVHNILGMAQAALSDPEAAISSFRQALSLKPGWAEAEANLGLALHVAGLTDQARGHLERAVARNPKLAEAWNTLSLVRLDDGELEQALEAAEQAISANASDVNALNSHGLVLRALHRDDAALASFRKAQNAAPGHGPSFWNLIDTLAKSGRQGEAITLLEAALEQRLDQVRLRTTLAELTAQTGRRDMAVAMLRDLIDEQPEADEACRILSMLHRFKPDDPLLAPMRARWHDSALDVAGRMQLGFALGKALEDVGEYTDAFDCLATANALRRKSLPHYSSADSAARFQRIRAVFSSDLANACAGLVPSSAAPIFVVGMNRSGTTLAEQILASHSQVTGAGELPFVDEFGLTTLSRMTCPPRNPSP